MAKIFFVPICTKCEHIITSDVDFAESKDGLFVETHDRYRDIVTPLYEITPPICPNCGKVFEEIVMPILPFKWYREILHD
jgi:predicted RNA-binding Zn-ribbon protein involved in translation (DUF1610 family)